MNYIFPTDEQIRREICLICDKAIQPNQGICSFVNNMCKHVGIKNVFWGSYDSIIIALVLFLTIGFGIPDYIIANPNAKDQLIVFVFSFSPMLYLVIIGLTCWKEIQESSFAIKMSCKYTIRHLIAFRMFVLSLFCVVINGVYIVSLCHVFHIPSILLLSVSLSSLFLFSLCFIETILREVKVRSIIFVFLIWIASSMIISILFKREFVAIVKAMPVAIWMMLILILSIGYLTRYRSFVRRYCYVNY